MVKKGALLVKEVVGHSIEHLRLKGNFSTPFPIKEVFEVRTSILPVKAINGRKGMAYFGNISIKLYCISSEDHCLHLIEVTVPLRGFAGYLENCQKEPPVADIKVTVQDVFTEEICSDSIKIFCLASAEIQFIRERVPDGLGVLLRPNEDVEVIVNINDEEESNANPSEYQFSVKDHTSDSGLIISDITVDKL